jgi:hypothetical protein
MTWLCLLLLLCAAAYAWQIASDSMLPGMANAVPAYGRTEGLDDSPRPNQEPCVRYADFDIYTAALMDRQQLRELEANLCPATP